MQDLNNGKISKEEIAIAIDKYEQKKKDKVLYVAGFFFSTDGTRVALIRKTKPAWQNGLLNGIGGKIEDGEEAIDAMRREFREETGVDNEFWRCFATLGGDSWEVKFFAAFGEVDAVRTTTEEEVVIVPTNKLEGTIPNLKWLVPLALDPVIETAVIKQ